MYTVYLKENLLKAADAILLSCYFSPSPSLHFLPACIVRLYLLAKREKKTKNEVRKLGNGGGGKAEAK